MILYHSCNFTVTKCVIISKLNCRRDRCDKNKILQFIKNLFQNNLRL